MDVLRRFLKVNGITLGLAIGLILAVFYVAGGTRGLLYQLELKAVDARFLLRGPRPADPRVAIVAVDARSIDAFGQWPWRRDLVGQVVQKAIDAGARSVALDIVFSEPARCDTAEDVQLAGLLRESGNPVLGYMFVLPGEEANRRSGSNSGNIACSEINVASGPRGGFQIASAALAESNIDVIASASRNCGFFTISPDPDGVVRFYYSLLEFDGNYYASLALKALQVYTRGDYLELSAYQRTLPRIRVGERQLFHDEEGRILLNYRGPGRVTFPEISAVDLLEGKVDPAALEDRVVFLGITETGVGDIRPTPFDAATPGVEVHATAADNILRGDYMRRTFAIEMIDVGLLLLFCMLAGWIMGLFRNPVWGALAVIGLLLLCAVANFAAFASFAVWLAIVPLSIGVVFSATSSSVHKNFFAEEKARLIRKTFSQVVSPGVVDEMLKNPGRVRLGGERRELTVLFSDIRGFTSLSEKMNPEAVLQILNEYLTPMTSIIFNNQGTVDKYMGDAIMAIWNAPTDQPEHAKLACRAALGMKEALRELNRGWKENRRLPDVQIGVGVNTGPMSVGYMGSEMIKSYTALGDNVNLGSRLEGLNKYYQTDIAVSHDTRARAGAEFYFRELDRVRVVGKKTAVTVYQLVERADKLGHRKPFYEAYHAALERYRARDFRGALAGFQGALTLLPDDFPTQMYINRATVYAAKPPDIDWDGVVTLDSK